jgi:hypothetical protein
MANKIDINKIASNLIAGPMSHRFTKMVPVKLMSEGGTDNSLKNAKAIQEAGYEFQSGITYYDSEKANWDTVVWFKRGNESPVSWTFKGFSAGYSGQGPRGLIEFGKIFNVPIKEEIVMDGEYLTSRIFLDGSGVNLAEYY